jgi:hypothetical protein
VPPAASTGRGGFLADDREDAEGVNALAFWQVVEQARTPTLGMDAAGAGAATIAGSNKSCMQQAAQPVCNCNAEDQSKEPLGAFSERH